VGGEVVVDPNGEGLADAAGGRECAGRGRRRSRCGRTRPSCRGRCLRAGRRRRAVPRCRAAGSFRSASQSSEAFCMASAGEPGYDATGPAAVLGAGSGDRPALSILSARRAAGGRPSPSANFRNVDTPLASRVAVFHSLSRPWGIPVSSEILPWVRPPVRAVRFEQAPRGSRRDRLSHPHPRPDRAGHHRRRPLQAGQRHLRAPGRRRRPVGRRRDRGGAAAPL
jgi:hypothetical protein